MDTEIIDQVSEQLGDEIRNAVAKLGTDVTLALLIHHLHEVSLQRENERAA